MSTARTSARGRRWTAEERREAILEAAISEFAQGGLAGASTEAIARRAGISHAYLFRLFGTKRELFLAAAERSYEQVLEAFREAARTHTGPAPIERSLGEAYRRLIEDRKELMFQAYVRAVAAADEEVRGVVRRRYGELFRWVQHEAGLGPDAARLFFAVGLLIDTAAALDMPELEDHGEWPRRATMAVRAAEARGAAGDR